MATPSEFYLDIDLNQNEIHNPVYDKQPSAPSSPVEGQYYYNTVDKITYFFNGTVWVAGGDGDTGVQGDTGVAGDTGVSGSKGDTGTSGVNGDTGVKGDTGTKGDTGSGIQGDTGADGGDSLTFDEGLLRTGDDVTLGGSLSAELRIVNVDANPDTYIGYGDNYASLDPTKERVWHLRANDDNNARGSITMGASDAPSKGFVLAEGGDFDTNFYSSIRLNADYATLTKQAGTGVASTQLLIANDGLAVFITDDLSSTTAFTLSPTSIVASVLGHGDIDYPRLMGVTWDGGMINIPSGDTGTFLSQVDGNVGWVTAPSGVKGDTGAGTKGDTGTSGVKGDTGTAGTTGSKGDTGTAGSSGAKGDTGTAGSTGSKGDTGTAGTSGAKGDTGTSGGTGAKGDTGVKGDTGSTANRFQEVVFVLDGGGVVPTLGLQKVFRPIPYTGTITGWYIVGEPNGSCVIEVHKAASGTKPTISNAISGSEKPTLTAAGYNSDTSLTTWTTSVSPGDIIGIELESVTTCTNIVLVIYIQQ